MGTSDHSFSWMTSLLSSLWRRHYLSWSSPEGRTYAAYGFLMPASTPELGASWASYSTTMAEDRSFLTPLQHYFAYEGQP